MRITVCTVLALTLLALNARGTARDKIVKSQSDGSYESGWSISIPAGSADFANTLYPNPGANTVVDGLSISVADFGTSIRAFPTVGLYRSNLSVDPSGFTPDLSSPYASVSYLLPPSFAQYEPLFIDLPNFSTSDPIHAVAQFPPGETGLLGIGLDSDVSFDRGGSDNGQNFHDASYLSQDGYATASQPDHPRRSGTFPGHHRRFS